MSHEEEHPEMGVDLMALAFKVMESAYIIRDNIYTVKGDYRKIRPKDKDKLLYILISYVGEFLALLGAHRTIAWDEITNYQIEMYPEYQAAIDGVQIDIIKEIQQRRLQAEKGDSQNSMFS